MDALLTALKDFITRDFMYVIGGGIVLLSFLWSFYPIDPNNIPTAMYLLGAGFSYAVGYIVQDGLSLLTPIVTTQHIKKPGCIVKFIYKKFTKNEWDDISIDLENQYAMLRRTKCARTWADFQRIVSLMHIGTTMGSCGVVSSVILFVHAFRTEQQLDFAIAFIMVFLGVVALLLGWVKGAQKAQLLAKFTE